MKQVAVVILALFLLRSSPLVHSQYVDSCDKNDINFNHIVNFDTTAMSCQIVWEKESFTLRYAHAGPELWSFLLSVYNPSSWIAMGFSTDGQMKGSSAMVGWMFPNSTGKALQYHLTGTDSSTVLPDQGNLTVVNNSATVFIESNRIYMAFQLITPQPLTDLIYAVGPYSVPSDSNGLKLSLHRERISTKIDFLTGKSQTQKSPYTGLRKTHGALNMIGWGILMPMGAIVARYCREWDPMWFYTHTAIQIFSFLFGVVGFMLGFVVEGFIKAEVTYHKNIGVTILILSCLQVTALLVRPQKKLKIRKYWNWYHHNAGRVLIILAVSNIFYGIRLGMEGTSWSATYSVIIAILFVTAVVLEFRLRRQR
ncbi:hypothetical protein RND81_13G141300 [Saponaria officinalis]|uniref:Cytochrome b561 and DOMON domain-containing protein n=1 Tax=Saponaria officinalis TaxID=3572 RepID=A0AAW1GXL4_SAPOF